jgi:glycine betaine/proline transport system substrate-binding protein
MNFKKQFGKVALVAGLGLSLIATGCSSETGNTGDSAEESGFGHITGIDAGAGVMQTTDKAIEEYGLDIELVPSSSSAMTAALKTAIDNEEWIVVTGWTPHWKFAAFDLKYLEDPKGVFGGEEKIHTIARQGLEADHPEAYQVLDNFNWTPDDMNSVMLDIAQNDMVETEAAQKWIDNNRDKVDAWIDGVGSVEGESLQLVYVPWDSEIASTNVIGLVLQDLGYEVELTPLDNGPMWTGVATGDADAMVAAWLPGTHGSFYDDVKDDVVDLGANLEGAKIGLVVPSYVDIDSIGEITE